METKVVRESAKGLNVSVERLATEEAPFHFTDSGLDNVYLVGVKYFTSESGMVVAEIPAIEQLMKLIARDIICSRSTLRGQEIRFLRKRLGKKSSDYCKILRVEKETLSRVENDKSPVSDQIDALARMSYIILSNDPALENHAAQLVMLLNAEIRRGQMKIVVQVSPDNEWSDIKKAA